MRLINIPEWFPIILVLFIFVILKVPYLTEPFFWDEAWVYAPALMQMAEQGPSLLPNVIDVYFSRGHPLFFHFLGGVYIQLFGKSLLALNSFALIISLTCIYMSFKLASSLFSTITGLFAAIILATNELFFVQSVFVLPEIMMSTLVLCSIHYYIKRANISLFISLSLLGMTKETGLVLILSLLVSHLISKFIFPKLYNSKTVSSILASLVVFSSTFLLNKFYLGWYFYPGHTDYINYNIDYIIPRMKRIIGDLVSYNQHWLLMVPIGISLIWYHFETKHLFLSMLCLFSFCTFSLFRYFPLDWQPMLGIFLMFIITGAFLVLRTDVIPTKVIEFYRISLGFSIAYILFSALNFYTNRYILSLLPLYIISASWAVTYLSQNNKIIILSVLLACTLFQVSKIYYFKQTKESYGQCYDIIECHKSFANFLVKNVEEGANVKVDFLMYHHFNNPNNGYYDHSVKDINWKMWGGYEYVVYENILSDFEKHFKNLESKNEFQELLSCSGVPKYKSTLYKKMRPKK